MSEIPGYNIILMHLRCFYCLSTDSNWQNSPFPQKKRKEEENRKTTFQTITQLTEINLAKKYQSN